MTENKTDLFGEVVVTWDDVRLWLAAVPRIDPDSPRAANYFTGWNVPAKIRAAKLAGTFEAITQRPRQTGAGHHPRLRWQFYTAPSH